MSLPVAVARTWRPVVAYTGVSAANQMLWLTYTPFTTGAARHYGVSSGAIGWLAEIFPLLYVVLAVPTGRLLDQRLPLWLGVGAVLTAAGAVVRVIGGGYGFALAGQVLVAVAQPLVLNAVLAVSHRYLAPADRAKGIAVSSAGIFGGMVVALVLGAAFGAGNLRTLLLVQALLAVAATAALCGYLRVPSRVATAVTSAAQRRLRDVWADPVLRRLVGLACVGFGVFVALTTWLQALLEPAGVSADDAGLMLLVMVVVGVAGSAVLPPLLAARGREPVFIAASIGAGVAGLLALAAAPGVVVGFVALAVIGAALLTDLPVLLELVDRRAGGVNGAVDGGAGAAAAAASATAGALVWLAGNAAGLVAALIVQALQDRPAVAFVVQAVLLALGVPLLVGVWRAAGGPTDRRP